MTRTWCYSDRFDSASIKDLGIQIGDLWKSVSTIGVIVNTDSYLNTISVFCTETKFYRNYELKKSPGVPNKYEFFIRNTI